MRRRLLPSLAWHVSREQTLGALLCGGQDMLREERILQRRSSHWLEAHAADEPRKDAETFIVACGPRPATSDSSLRIDMPF